MKEDSNSVESGSAFSRNQGFPSEPKGVEQQKDNPGYEYYVLKPEPIEHKFPKPDVPNPPKERSEFESHCRAYTKCVMHEYYDVIPLRWEDLTVLDDGRFTRAIGKCSTWGDHAARVRISWKHYNDKGYSWDRMKETIRHELVHAWQAQWLGYTSHGPTFVKKAEKLDCGRLSRYDGKKEPKYVMVCQNCGNTYTRQRMCKAVRRTNYYRCSHCDMVERRFGRAEETGGLWNSYQNTDWRKVL